MHRILDKYCEVCKRHYCSTDKASIKFHSHKFVDPNFHLRALIHYFNRFTPYPEIDRYEKNTYDPVNYDGGRHPAYEGIINTERDMYALIKSVTEMFAIRRAKWDGYLCTELHWERDAYPYEKNKYGPTYFYNRQVIEVVESFCKFIVDTFKIIFYPNFTPGWEGVLGIKQSFDLYYEKFGV